MNKYGLQGKFKVYEGKRDELISVLLQAAKLVSTAKGCHHYIIYKDTKDEDCVFVSEIWDTKEDHDNSLKIQGCMELISKAMPLIDGKPEGNSLEVIGGKGLDF
ncbi:MAG: antibiotic biosynthesis monooxygenase family protein [Ginsengibacter sp.]